MDLGNGVEFKGLEYGNGQSDKAVALVAGFRGKFDQIEDAAVALMKSDYDVVSYEFDESVIMDGDASLLPELIKNLGSDFQSRVLGHSVLRFAGVSAGAGIAWNMQKDVPQETKPGLYAAAGADTARLMVLKI